MTPECESEFQELLAYIELFATVVLQIDSASESHPAKVVEAIVQQSGRSKALIGLRQAVNDTIEVASSWSVEARAIVDEGFKAAGVVTVSEIARRYSSSYKRIIRRGQIQNETEYYVINAALTDQGNEIPTNELVQLQRLIDAYEAKC